MEKKEKPLTAEAVNRLVDCLIREDLNCAKIGERRLAELENNRSCCFDFDLRLVKEGSFQEDRILREIRDHHGSVEVSFALLLAYGSNV